MVVAPIGQPGLERAKPAGPIAHVVFGNGPQTRNTVQLRPEQLQLPVPLPQALRSSPEPRNQRESGHRINLLA